MADKFSEMVKEYRHDFIRLIVAVFALGVIYARMPTAGDLQEIDKGLRNLHATSIQRIESLEKTAMTREAVKAMLDSTENPWVPYQPLVVGMLEKYDKDQEKMQDLLRDIQVDLGVLLRERKKVPR